MKFNALRLMQFGEDDLLQMLKFVRGDLFPHMGPGIHTYPQGDASDRGKYEMCCELERRGLIKRTPHLNEPNHVHFEPAKE